MAAATFTASRKIFIGPKAVRDYVERSSFKYAARHVLAAIGSAIDWRGDQIGVAKLKVETICDRSGYSRRQVFNAIHELEEKGEIKRERLFRKSGKQRSSAYTLTGVLRFYGVGLKTDENALSEKENEEETIAPQNPENCTPIPVVFSGTTPLPQNNDSNSTRRAARTESPEKIEERNRLEKIALDALSIHRQIAAPKWGRLMVDSLRARLWLARRVLRMGGLEAWRKLLHIAKTSAWLRSKDFGLGFFTSPRIIAGIEAGAYGVAKETSQTPRQSQGPIRFSEERLRAEPWLAFVNDLQFYLRNIPPGKLSDLIHEANQRNIFGRLAKCYAIWKEIRK